MALRLCKNECFEEETTACFLNVDRAGMCKLNAVGIYEGVLFFNFNSKVGYHGFGRYLPSEEAGGR